MRETDQLPLFLDVRGKSCLVFGGGKVALRKVKRLLDAGAKVEVVSSEVCDEIEKLAKNDNVEVKHKQIESKYIALYIKKKYFMVITCTDDPEFNRKVARECRKAGILINSATMPEDGDVFFGAESGTKHLRFAVSTGGRSPLAARWFARWAAGLIPEKTDDFLENLHKLRISGMKMSEIGPQAWSKLQGLDWIKEIKRDGGKKIVEKIEKTGKERDKKREKEEN